VLTPARASITTAAARVAAKAVVEGEQDVRVQACTPLPGPHRQVALRVGRLLADVHDRDALDNCVDDW
jgi:hypothetical protein